MLDAAPFLEMIRDHPYDDGPRVVYADWLEWDAPQHDILPCPFCSGEGCAQHGHGDATKRCDGDGTIRKPTYNVERAELIRVQVKLAEIGPEPIDIGSDYMRYVGGNEFTFQPNVARVEEMPPIGSRVTVKWERTEKRGGNKVFRGMKVIKQVNSEEAEPDTWLLRKDEYTNYPDEKKLRTRSAALLATHGRSWAKPLTDVLPKCQGCNGKGFYIWTGAIDSDTPAKRQDCQTCHGSGLAPPLAIHWELGFVAVTGLDMAAFVGWEIRPSDGQGSGFGRLPGLAVKLGGVLMPVVKIEFAGREPQAYPSRESYYHGWYRGQRNENRDEPFNVPTPLWAIMAEMPNCAVHGPWADFPTAALAFAALSDAAVKFMRKEEASYLLCRDSESVPFNTKGRLE